PADLPPHLIEVFDEANNPVSFSCQPEDHSHPFRLLVEDKLPVLHRDPERETAGHYGFTFLHGFPPLSPSCLQSFRLDLALVVSPVEGELQFQPLGEVVEAIGGVTALRRKGDNIDARSQNLLRQIKRVIDLLAGKAVEVFEQQDTTTLDQ